MRREDQRVDGDQNGVQVDVDRFSSNANADGLNAVGIVEVGALNEGRQT